MASTDLDLNDIGFKDPLRSKPIRANFTDIENNFNALRSEVNASIASTASEVTAARDNFTSLSENLNVRRVYGDRVDGTASYQVTNETGLTVRVALGSGMVNGIGVEHATSATASVSVPAAGNSRIDAVVVATDNSRAIVSGSATTGTPADPSFTDTQAVLAKWTIYDTTSTLSIEDARLPLIAPFTDKEYKDYSFTFSGATATQYTLTDDKGCAIVVALTYTGATMASAGATIDGVRHSIDYTYSGNTLASYSQNIN